MTTGQPQWPLATNFVKKNEFKYLFWIQNEVKIVRDLSFQFYAENVMILVILFCF